MIKKKVHINPIAINVRGGASSHIKSQTPTTQNTSKVLTHGRGDGGTLGGLRLAALKAFVAALVMLWAAPPAISRS